MFVDKVQVEVTAGKGGDGYVSFRQEKFIDRGGPDGGDGGHGGSVVVVGSTREHTLSRFRHDKLVKADDGQNGFKKNMHGRTAKDLIIDVPVGTTVVRVSDKTVLADITEEGQRAIIARGGRGGFGNAHFVSSIRQAPRVAEKGEAGDEYDALFELKSIADVGIIGLPNAGKSTLLSVVSNAKPEIANYPFTTLVPNLGVASIGKEDQLVLADIPGLIEGASQGKGLGDEFLRHVERTKLLLHLIDVYSNDVAADYKVIRAELEAYSPALAHKPEIVALSKIEGFDPELLAMQVKELKKVLPKGTKLLAFSASSHAGVPELLKAILKLTKTVQPAEAAEENTDLVPVIRPIFDDRDRWELAKTDHGWLITGRKVERFARRTDFENDFGVQRLRDIMRKMGIMRELIKKGAERGDKLTIGKPPIATIEM